MLLSGIRRRFVLAMALVWTWANPAAALTIDFGESETWTDPTSTQEIYSIGPGTVTVTITDANGSLVTSAADAAGPSPLANSYLNPPDNAANNPNPEGLFLRTDGNTAPWVRVNIDFVYTGGVQDVTFDLFDVDLGAGQWTDDIRVRARDFATGTWSSPTTVVSPGVAPVWVWNGANRITGTGASDGPGNASDDGTARISFMGGTYDRIQLVYRNLDPAAGNQWITLSDIDFVPEPATGLLVMIGLLWIGASRGGRRA
jgi:hypothetical protein